MTVTNFLSNCLDPTFPSSDGMLYLVKRGQLPKNAGILPQPCSVLPVATDLDRMCNLRTLFQGSQSSPFSALVRF